MIKLKNITFSYHHCHEPFLQGLNLTFSKGKITVLVGPNGCGKSTLLRICAGLLRPSAGQVELSGVSLTGMDPKALAQKLTILSQTNRIPDIPVEAFIRLGRSPHRSYWSRFSRHDKMLAEQAMRRTDTFRLRDKSLCALSGGERQRVYIAMALTQDTETILLDEPTTYLDISVQFELMELIRTLRHEEGKTIIMVLHDLNLALSYADDLVVMENGKISACGSLEDPHLIPAIEQAFGIHIEPVFLRGAHHFICQRQLIQDQTRPSPALQHHSSSTVSPAFAQNYSPQL